MKRFEVISDGHGLVESPRWHHGRLWFADWTARQVLACRSEGVCSTVVEVSSMPLSFDWLPDGTMLIVSGGDGRLLRVGGDGSIAEVAALHTVSPHPWNDMAIDARGNTYVGFLGFDFPMGEFRPGGLGRVQPDGQVEVVADGLEFPNGIAILPGGRTLVVAESYGSRLTAFDIASDGSLTGRRVWADLGDEAAPDGICVDATGTIWYADVGNQHCVRVREGGEVLNVVDLDRGCFACALGGTVETTLYVATAAFPEVFTDEGNTSGRLVAVELDSDEIASDPRR